MRRFLAMMSGAMVLGAVVLSGCQKKNKPPDVPSVPSGPSAGRMGAPYGFTSSAADPDDDSVALRFDWGDGDTSGWSTFVASGDSVRAARSWADSGTYSLKAQARDKWYATSGWSAEHAVRISIDTAAGWPRTYGGTGYDYGHSVCPTEDGGYIIAGTSNSADTHGEHDVYLVKTDAAGNSGWQRHLGGASTDEAFSVQQTADGGYIVAGWTASWPSFDEEMYLAKVDAGGGTVWEQHLGEDNQPDRAFAVQQTRDGGYILVGVTRLGLITHEYELYLVKRGADGSHLWSYKKGFENRDEAGYSVQQTSDDGYIMVGSAESDSGDLNVFLLKARSGGETDWWKKIWPGSGKGTDIGYSVQQTPDGGYIIAGSTNSAGTAGGTDVYLVRTNSAGVPLWQRTIGGPEDDVGYSVQVLPDGGYIVAGYTKSFGHGGKDVYLVRVDAAGDTVWTRTFGGTGDDEARSVRRHYDNYIVAGTTTTAANATDVYLVKVDPDGNVVR